MNTPRPLSRSVVFVAVAASSLGAQSIRTARAADSRGSAVGAFIGGIDLYHTSVECDGCTTSRRDLLIPDDSAPEYEAATRRATHDGLGPHADDGIGGNGPAGHDNFVIERGRIAENDLVLSWADGGSIRPIRYPMADRS